jgi:hypothetical protein
MLPSLDIGDISAIDRVLTMTVKLGATLAKLIGRQIQNASPMSITVYVHVVVPVFLVVRQGQPEPAMLGVLAGLDGLVDQPGHDVIEPFGQKLLGRVSPRVILLGCRNGKIQLRRAPAYDFGIVVKTVDNEDRDVHLRAEG